MRVVVAGGEAFQTDLSVEMNVSSLLSYESLQPLDVCYAFLVVLELYCAYTR